MADAGIWIIWDHCVLLGGGARARHLDLWRQPGREWEGRREHWGGEGKLGNSSQPLVGRTDDRQASFFCGLLQCPDYLHLTDGWLRRLLDGPPRTF
jgi:hypothetical protein